MRLAHLRHAAAIVAVAAQLALAHDDLRARVARVGPLRSHPKVGVCDDEHRDVPLIHPFCALAEVIVDLEGKAATITGTAKVAELDECTAFNVLGRLIKDKYNEETALTECVIGVK